jgi:hypothetical protein
VELGYWIYFFVVFGLGGVLLLGLTTYFGWEIVTRHQRPSWSERSLQAKMALIIAGLVFLCLLYIPIRMIWVTRISAIPGSYTSDGVWGSAKLRILSDGTFVETWHFTNAYTGKSEGDGETHGTWSDKGRDWLTRDIELGAFKQLAEYNRDRPADITGANVMGYSGSTSIEVDAGSDIVFIKHNAKP